MYDEGFETTETVMFEFTDVERFTATTLHSSRARVQEIAGALSMTTAGAARAANQSTTRAPSNLSLARATSIDSSAPIGGAHAPAVAR